MSDAERKEALKERAEEMAAEEKRLNEGKTGKGTRTQLGMTRGKNPQKIKYEAFDQSQPDTLPADVTEFMNLVTNDEKKLLNYLIEGYNEVSYTEASDPIAEFVEATWPEEVQKQFRVIVRNYANATKVSIEEAVKLIKPGVLASQSAQ